MGARGVVNRARQTALLEWYDTNARALPWRDAPAGARDPYRTWLSEVLLQQTQVARATNYFTAFLEAFPRVQDLAAAPLEAVLKRWEGAGYYARARQLHQSAQLLAESGFPDSLAGWLSLPGIGPYSAGAILSLSRNAAVPAVDGNVRRVLARWYRMAQPSQSWLWATATALLDCQRPGAWNEALIELGATLCLPRQPLCSACPVSSWCQALAHGQSASVPSPKPAVRPLELQAVALLAHQGSAVLLEQRPKSGLLGGLHGIPLEPITNNRESALALLLRRFSLPDTGHWIGQVSHRMTHRAITLEVYALALDSRRDLPFVHPASVALSRLDQKVLAALTPRQGTLF